MKRFEGRRALVTGASRGLGRDMALRLASEGASVFVGFRNRRAEAEDCAAACAAFGVDASPLALELEDAASARAAIVALPPLDVLVNNAATLRDQFFLLQSDDDDAEVIATNLNGTMACIRAALPGMLRAGHGVIVNVASVAGLHGSPGQASYAASKGGVIALTQTLARELAGRAIRVNAVLPGSLMPGWPSAWTTARERLAWTRFRWVASGVRKSSRAWWRSWLPTTPATLRVRRSSSTEA